MKRLASALWADKMTLFALVVFSGILLSVLFGPMIIPHSSTQQNLLARNLPPFSSAGDGSALHLLGTDQLGRDLLARLLEGGRISLSIGFTGVLLAGTFGTMLGVIAGYFRGPIDNFIMRVVDAQLALPFLLVALFVLFVFGRGTVNVVLVLVFVRWPVYTRVARSLALQIRSQPYIDGARVLGARQSRIILGHVVPNLLSPMIVLGTLEVARLIIAESTLSFLGMGVQPPGSSWGLMVAQGQDVMGTAPWIVGLSGAVIFITALSVTLLATWMRTVTDPAQRWRWLQGKAKPTPRGVPVSGDDRPV
jgi:peptide/nickel transport system permease protein